MENGNSTCIMKKSHYIFVLAALFLGSCQEEETVKKTGSMLFVATTEDYDPNITTRTLLDKSSNVLWKKGDQISIFVGSKKNEQYQVNDASDSLATASLTKVSSSEIIADDDIDKNIAYYPYSSSATISKDGGNYVISGIFLPSVQNYVESSFGNGAFPMAAVSSTDSDYNLKFKNVLGGLKLQLKGTTAITSISIFGNNNEILCGAARVTASSTEVPGITMTDTSAKSVTLNCGAGIQLNASTATCFVIALPPTNFSKGFTIITTDTEGKQMEIVTSKSQTIYRSYLLNMPAVELKMSVVEYDKYLVPELEDLGLPSGNMWATCNLGATKPEKYGDYYAWGETSPKEEYTEENWKWFKDTKEIVKYNNKKYDKLELEDDVVYMKCGAGWHIPTLDDYKELVSCCKTTETTQNGVKGKKFTSKINGNSIFFPYAGRMFGNSLYYRGVNLYAYLSTCFSYIVRDGDGLTFKGNNSYGFFQGYSVRPVYNNGSPNKKQPENPPSGMVDLGLTVKWGSCNLGATKPEEFGGFYQWAGTEDVSDTSLGVDWWTSGSYIGAPYVSCSENHNLYFSKYCIIQCTNGFLDNKSVLDLEDDAASVQLGGKWRIPTHTEWYELYTNCSWTYIVLNGVGGYKAQSNVSGYTNKWIFLPSAGYRVEHSLHKHECKYWSSTLMNNQNARHFDGDNKNSLFNYGEPRYMGMSIRPVSE